MERRVEEHAELLVDYCIDAGSDDDVIINAPAVAEDLVVAIYKHLGTVGANPRLNWYLHRAQRAYHREMDAEEYRTPRHHLAEVEAADAEIVILGNRNTHEGSDVDPEKKVATSQAKKPIYDERQGRQVITQYPGPGNAQQAEMSTAEYEDFVWGAINKDWETQQNRQRKVAEILQEGEDVRIVSGETTDVRMSIDPMLGYSDDGKHNMPGGEVFTAPVPDSVEGEVSIDRPVELKGEHVHDIYLRFEEGEVVEFDAEDHVDTLEATLGTDDGARRLGEFGIGMNRDIDRFTGNMLFDEKMSGTIHLALGDAIPQSVPEGVTANESAKHIDMLVDVTVDSFIEIDGEVVQRNGDFTFEDSEKEQ